jgi:hypothetical protein
MQLGNVDPGEVAPPECGPRENDDGEQDQKKKLVSIFVPEFPHSCLPGHQKTFSAPAAFDAEELRDGRGDIAETSSRTEVSSRDELLLPG